MTQAPVPPITNAAPLTGQALLDRFSALRTGGMSHSDIAVECGYYIKIEDGPKAGEIRASGARLNAALLRANGVDVPEGGARSAGASRSGRSKVVINSQGRASLSQKMVGLMGAEKGDYLELVEANDQGIALKLVRQNVPAPQLVAV